MSQANHYFFARKREKKLGFFSRVSAKKKIWCFFGGVFWCFFCLFFAR